MKKGVLLTFILALVLGAPLAFADDVWTMAQSDQYKTKAGGQLGRGVVNAATCFVDLIQHTVEGTQDGAPLIGTMTGLGSGIGCTVLRAGSGVLDVATFWVPGFNGIPVSKSYSNCLEEDVDTVTYSNNNYGGNYATPVPQNNSAPAAPVAAQPAPTHDPMEYVKK